MQNMTTTAVPILVFNQAECPPYANHSCSLSSIHQVTTLVQCLHLIRSSPDDHRISITFRSIDISPGASSGNQRIALASAALIGFSQIYMFQSLASACSGRLSMASVIALTVVGLTDCNTANCRFSHFTAQHPIRWRTLTSLQSLLL